MPTLSKDAAKAPAGAPGATPYGLVGLVLSTLAILAVTVAILAGLGLAGFGIWAARDGVEAATHQVVDLVHSLDADQDATDRVGIVGGIVAYLVLVVAVALVARFRSRTGWADLVGWRPWDMWRSLPLVLLLLAATLFYSLLASSLIEQVYPQAKDWVQTPKGTPWIVAFLAMATLFAPIAEELLFRGWIYTSLRGVIGVRWGILVSAVLFALAHWESTHLYALAVFPVGLALGYLRQRADSIAASITFHSLYNGIAAVLLFAAAR